MDGVVLFWMLFIAGWLFLLFIGGLIADYIIPYIKPLNDWLEELAKQMKD